MFARPFVLDRRVDETGISGVGVVAWGVQFPDGSCALRWCSEHTSTAVYASIEDVVAIHGHSGATRIVWADSDGQDQLLEQPHPALVGSVIARPDPTRRVERVRDL